MSVDVMWWILLIIIIFIFIFVFEHWCGVPPNFRKSFDERFQFAETSEEEFLSSYQEKKHILHSNIRRFLLEREESLTPLWQTPEEVCMSQGLLRNRTSHAGWEAPWPAVCRLVIPETQIFQKACEGLRLWGPGYRGQGEVGVQLSSQAESVHSAVLWCGVLRRPSRAGTKPTHTGGPPIQTPLSSETPSQTHLQKQRSPSCSGTWGPSQADTWDQASEVLPISVPAPASGPRPRRADDQLMAGCLSRGPSARFLPLTAFTITIQALFLPPRKQTKYVFKHCPSPSLPSWFFMFRKVFSS